MQIEVEKEVIGEGKFGRVHRGSVVESRGEKRSAVAIKIVIGEEEKVEWEISVALHVNKSLKDEECLVMQPLWRTEIDASLITGRQGIKYKCIIYPLARSDMLDYLKHEKCLDLQLMKAMMRDMCRAVIQMHAAGVSHGDVSLENFLLMHDKRVLLADMGLANALHASNPSHVQEDRRAEYELYIAACDMLYKKHILREEDVSSFEKTVADARRRFEYAEYADYLLARLRRAIGDAHATKIEEARMRLEAAKIVSMCKVAPARSRRASGKTMYMSPEMLRWKEFPFDQRKADVWALSICYFAMVFGHLPFYSAEASDSLFSSFCASGLDAIASVGDRDMSAVNFIRFCLHPSESTRPSAEEILSHPFLSVHSV